MKNNNNNKKHCQMLFEERNVVEIVFYNILKISMEENRFAIDEI